MKVQVTGQKKKSQLRKDLKFYKDQIIPKGSKKVDNSKVVSMKGSIENETEKGILFKIDDANHPMLDGQEIWFPKSRTDFCHYKDHTTLDCEEWLYNKKVEELGVDPEAGDDDLPF